MPPYSRCVGIKGNGLRCEVGTRNPPGEDGNVRCGIHIRTHANELHAINLGNERYGPLAPGACTHLGRHGGVRCGRNATANGLCQQHINIAERAAERAAERLRLRAANQLVVAAQRQQQEVDDNNTAAELTDQALLENPLLLWSDYADRWHNRTLLDPTFRFSIFQRACIRLCRFMHPDENPYEKFRQYYFQRINHGFPGLLQARHAVHQVHPVVQPLRDLERIARDTQSVHTGVVTVQTNKGLEKLLAYPVPIYQVTCVEIARMWLNRPANKINMDLFEQVLTDMTRWYKTPSCKENNDYLYKRALDGLWAIISQITDKSVHTEVCKRLREELRESYKMCCEGHISRMVNVMVGFDESFEQNIPVGELLQQRMGAIAALDLETADAVARARQVLIELAIPQDQHSAWLDAF